MRIALACTTLAAAASALAAPDTLPLRPAAANARPLIAPLDVRVTGEARPTTVLKGSWNVSSQDGGMWDGQNVTMTETWARGAKLPVRIRGRAAGGPSRTTTVEVAYLASRTGTGVLTEASPTPVPNPVQLICHAQGGTEQGQRVGTSNRVTLQITDQPARDRVVIRGPGIPFIGPECTLGQADPAEGQDVAARPWRRVGLLPHDEQAAWRPMGARGSWQMTVPRAEFAAGGTFRFRGTYAVAAPLQFGDGTSDVSGSGLMTGTVAIDLHVRRISRR